MLVKLTYLVCDNACGTTFGKDNQEREAGEHRKFAYQAGWAYLVGEDFCPACVTKLGFKLRGRYRHSSSSAKNQN